MTALERAAARDDVRFVRGVVDRWWANRSLHVGVDGVDPERIFDDLQTVAEDVGRVEELVVALREGFWHLGDGHLRVDGFHSRSLEPWVSGLACEQVGGDVVLTAAPPEGGRRRGDDDEGPAPARGDRIVEVDGRPIDDFVASVRLRPGSTPGQRQWNAVESLVWRERFLWDPPGPGSITVEIADGRRDVVALRWRQQSGTQPTPHCVTGRMIEPNIGLLTVRSFVCRDARGEVSDSELVRQAHGAARALDSAGALLVDLRGNGGGRDEQARIVASLLLTEPIEWMRVDRRDSATAIATASGGEALVDRLEPAGELAGLLAGRPVRLLVGPGCASTSEILVAALQQRPDVEVWGATTAGSVGDPVEFRLPMSGLAFTVPVAVFYVPGSASPIEAHGIAPDLPLPVTVDDYRLSADPVLARALEALRNTPQG